MTMKLWTSRSTSCVWQTLGVFCWELSVVVFFFFSEIVCSCSSLKMSEDTDILLKMDKMLAPQWVGKCCFTSGLLVELLIPTSCSNGSFNIFQGNGRSYIKRGKMNKSLGSFGKSNTPSASNMEWVWIQMSLRDFGCNCRSLPQVAGCFDFVRYPTHQ